MSGGTVSQDGETALRNILAEEILIRSGGIAAEDTFHSKAKQSTEQQQ